MLVTLLSYKVIKLSVLTCKFSCSFLFIKSFSLLIFCSNFFHSKLSHFAIYLSLFSTIYWTFTIFFGFTKSPLNSALLDLITEFLYWNNVGKCHSFRTQKVNRGRGCNCLNQLLRFGEVINSSFIGSKK